jgi:hypothetical protein
MTHRQTLPLHVHLCPQSHYVLVIIVYVDVIHNSVLMWFGILWNSAFFSMNCVLGHLWTRNLLENAICIPKKNYTK